jgi:outer membrane autotransporter protein
MRNITVSIVSVAGIGLLGYSAGSLAVTVDDKAVIIGSGQHVKVDSNSPTESYVLSGTGRLESDGATIERIDLRTKENRADLRLTNGTLVLKGINASGTVTIKDSTLKSDYSSALVLQFNAKGAITDSVIESDGIALSIGAGSAATLAGTKVSALNMDASDREGWGIGVFASRVEVTEGSEVTGLANALLMTQDSPGAGPVGTESYVVVDASTLTGLTGAAIKVKERNGAETFNTIDIRNGARLVSGNGNLLEVDGGVTASFNIYDTKLVGDITADTHSTLNVRLGSGATLVGNIVNGDSVDIVGTGRWQMLDGQQVDALNMTGGRVGFSKDGFSTLTVGRLSGGGVFDMRVNLDNGASDLLNVLGPASGSHHLSIANTGSEIVPETFDPLRVVHTEGGDAEFALVGGRADLGVYSYALEQQGNDWFIVGSGKIVSPSTQSALALFSAGPTIWNNELTTLRSRMGEVRGQEQGGGWIRSYGNRFNASLDAGVDYQQNQQGLSFGADAPIPVNDGHLLVGLMGGYSKSDLDMSRGTSGEVDSYYVGAYGTWLSDEGYYVDGVLKLNQFHNASKVAMSDGSKAKGDYSNKAVGGSVEFGKHIKLPDDYFVAPYAQLSSVWVEGNSYTLDNGLQARTSQTQSVLGKVGSTVGRQFALKDGGVVQPYVRVALAHEFSRSNDVSVNDQRFDNDLFGSRAELGAGVSVALSERLQVHADFDYMKGEHVEQPWGANVGLRLAF